MRLSTFASPLALACAAPAAAQTIALPDVVLSANRAATPADRTGASVSVLTERDFETDGRPFVLDYLAETPGVTVQQTGPAGTVSGFAVRGAPQQYVRVLIDGIEVSDPTGPQVTPYLQGLLIDDVSRIEVLRGSQSALYGGQAVAGVIDITSPRPTEAGIENRLILEGGSYSTFRGSYSLSGLSDRGDFALTVARLSADGFSAAEEADGNTEDDGFDTTRISASGTFYATDQMSLFGAAFWQKEDGDFDASAPVDAPNTFDTESWGARAGADFTALDARLQNRVALSYYHIDKTQNEVDPASGPSTFHTEGARTRAEYIGNYAWSDDLALQFGADYTYERTETSFASGGIVTPSGPDSNWDAGIFAQANWSPSEPLTLNAAFRYDEHSEFGGYPTGRLTAAYSLPSDTILRASFGTGFRPPSNFELFDAFSGNPDLEPETSTSADMGVEQIVADGRGTVSATLFWLEIEDLIEFRGEFPPPDFVCVGPCQFVQVDGTAESKGVELAAAWALTDALTLSGGYTYTDARLPDGAPRNRVPRHDLTVRLDGALTDRIDLGLGAQYIADYVDNSGPERSNGFDEDFWLVNARVAYAVTGAAELYVRAENLFDQQYQTARGFTASGQAFYFGLTGQF